MRVIKIHKKMEMSEYRDDVNPLHAIMNSKVFYNTLAEYFNSFTKDSEKMERQISFKVVDDNSNELFKATLGKLLDDKFIDSNSEYSEFIEKTFEWLSELALESDLDYHLSHS